jgi:hypothetical protein
MQCYSRATTMPVVCIVPRVLVFCVDKSSYAIHILLSLWQTYGFMEYVCVCAHVCVCVCTRMLARHVCEHMHQQREMHGHTHCVQLVYIQLLIVPIFVPFMWCDQIHVRFFFTV